MAGSHALLVEVEDGPHAGTILAVGPFGSESDARDWEDERESAGHPPWRRARRGEHRRTDPRLVAVRPLTA